MKKRNVKDKQKQEEPETTKLEIQEYVFDGLTPNRHVSKEDWLEFYQEKANTTCKETAKMYNKVVHFPYPNVALKTMRDHATDTLTMALIV